MFHKEHPRLFPWHFPYDWMEEPCKRGDSVARYVLHNRTVVTRARIRPSVLRYRSDYVRVHGGLAKSSAISPCRGNNTMTRYSMTSAYIKFVRDLKLWAENLGNVKRILHPLRIGIFYWVQHHLNGKKYGILLGIVINFQKFKHRQN